MIRTQIQLPDELYQRAKRLAEAKEVSLTELARRGLEYIVSVYPEPEKVCDEWQPPDPQRLGWLGASHEEVKDAAYDDADRSLE